MIRWGIIGTGDISGRVAPDIIAMPGNDVAAVWGRRLERARTLADDLGIADATTDLDALVKRDDIDAVYIATPIGTHLEIGLAALEAGKHVLLEKPIATNAREATQLFDKAAEVGRFLMEGMWMKFNPLHRGLAARIADGVIGQPRSIRAGFGTPFPPGGSRWDAELGGSTVLDQGIYPITLAQWMLGDPVSVRARGVVRDRVDVHAVIELEFTEGRVGQIVASAIEFADPSASISGTAGWMSIDRMFWATNSASVFGLGIPSLFTPPERVEIERVGNGFRPMIQAAHDAIRDGLLQHPEHDRAATLRVAETMDAVRGQIFAGAGLDTDRQ